MPKAEKIAKVDELTKKLNEASSVLLTDFTGLNVQEISDLRKSMRGASVDYLVVKNTLARLSVKSAGQDELLEFLDGPTALAFGLDDPVAPARVFKEFTKKNEKLKFKACLFDGVLIGAERLDEIANLPSKEVLLGKLLSVLNAPIANLAHALNGVLVKLVLALDAVREQKEKSQ